MNEPLGKGLWGSLRRRVDRDIKQLSRENRILRRARYPLGRRLLRAIVERRSAIQFISGYLLIVAASIIGDRAIGHLLPDRIPDYPHTLNLEALKDLASYLIAGQIGILAIVSVAVGVVTLLSDRDDGASVNTDIRLYYFESYAYELAISGVALLLVLTLQLFWPLHHVFRFLLVATHGDWSKLVLSAVHASWFCINLILFLQFIITTLRFVEPSEREALREGYSANEVIPRAAKARLMRVLYKSASSQVFGGSANVGAPGITFGYAASLADDLTTEIRLTFRAPSKLVDVRLRPLKWALAKWRMRVQNQLGQRPHSNVQFWKDALAITPRIDEELDGEHALVERRGSVALNCIEKWVIRRSFRFERAKPRIDNLPTPEDFLEQLVDKVVRQIEQGAPTGFDAALVEALRYHRFILASQNAKDEAGNWFNFAEVDSSLSRPDAQLVHQYRRAFIAAANKMADDTHFIDHLGKLTASLVPNDALNFSQRVLKEILALGIFEVTALQDWVTRHAVISLLDEIGTSAGLAGSDRRAYETALRDFVGNWESLLQVLVLALSTRRGTTAAQLETMWQAFAKALPIYQAHLHHAAYFLTTAVWNDDRLGADRFRDLLLRWLSPFYADLLQPYLVPNSLLLTPDICTQNWEAISAELASFSFAHETVLPGRVTGLVLREMHCDVICVSGLVALYWYATGQRPSETAAQAGTLTLQRNKRESDGSDLTSTEPKSNFRLLFDFTLRYAINPRFAEHHYGATIGGFIGSLLDVSASPMVMGRIYGGAYGDGFSTIRPVLLGAMATYQSPNDHDVALRLIESFKNDARFASDATVRNFIGTLLELLRSLDGSSDNQTFEKTARLLDRDIDLASATLRLRNLLTAWVTAFQTLRLERIRSAPLDEDRRATVRRAMSEAMSIPGPKLTSFLGYDIRRAMNDKFAIGQVSFGVLSRGQFTKPPMSDLPFNEVPGFFAGAALDGVSQWILRELSLRPKRTVSIDISTATDEFWQQTVSTASQVGLDPMLLVPFEIGMAISSASISSHSVAGMAVTRDPSIAHGSAARYLGSLEGMPVFSHPQLRRHAILCSRSLLRSITFGVDAASQYMADFEFIPGEDIEKCHVLIRWSYQMEWADDVFVEFELDRGDVVAESPTS